MRQCAAILGAMNIHTEAERNAARVIANSVRSTALAYSAGYAPDDGDAAAGALCARVAEMLQAMLSLSCRAMCWPIFANNWRKCNDHQRRNPRGGAVCA